MDFWTPIKDIATCLWSCSTTNVTYINDLDKNLASLRESLDELKSLNEDIDEEIRRAVGRKLKNQNEVQSWQRRAQKKLKTVEEFLGEDDQNVQTKRRGFRPKNCFSTYFFGVTVVEETAAVKILTDDRKKFELQFVLPPNALVEKLEVKPTVGSDTMFNLIWGYIGDQSVGVIAIYGMGGVGKTTLLKRINNMFVDTSHGFDAVIWVVLSENGSLRKIQETIRTKLNIADELWEKKKTDEEGKSALIRNILETKKFLLLLDDQRNQIDLLEAGIPLLENTNGSKVIFTTRSEDLFGTMKVLCGRTKEMKSVKVECLASNDAEQLLQMNLDKDIASDPQVSNYTKDLAKECKGLPLALITIGRAMARKRQPEAWQNAIIQLRSYPSESPGMKKDVFPKLRFSYDSLEDTEKKCFLYCALFPEDQQICKRELINLWIGEGLIRNFGRMCQARYRGVDIIGNLERACLLESCESKEHVKMHDVLRDMALWIICDEGKEEDKILVQQDAEWNRGRNLETWRKAVMVSLWGSHLNQLPDKTEFPHCKTLIVRETKLDKLPIGFFMDSLQVLDLSNNRNLIALPSEIKNLVRLQHLDLSYTDIVELPIAVKTLSKLKNLLIDGTEKLEVLPMNVIPCLESLQVFSKMKSICLNEKALLEELKGLLSVICLGITLKMASSITFLLESSELQSRISYLTVMKCSSLSSLDLSGMEFLETLEIRTCRSLQELVMTPLNSRSTMQLEYNLSHVVIRSCPIKNVNCLVYASRLQILELDDCPSIDALIDETFEMPEIKEPQTVFSNLQHLSLRYLPELKIICRQVLPLPQLTTIQVYKCPRLCKPPFNCDAKSRSYLKKIHGEESWWSGLQWEDEAAMRYFATRFIKMEDQRSFSRRNSDYR
ncbi:probable disease resistance protein At5g63020 [Mercurialis annua]|uniref:probable disease resistance protein At5g63020 n=1 Tax=Mercurialis annua TaxID=3986 RepID=UPI0024ACF7D3|nr:probable disease resistance protein At5g63020 [Mercurialis annua]